jgi:DNA-binding protein HU-beta
MNKTQLTSAIAQAMNAAGTLVLKADVAAFLAAQETVITQTLAELGDDVTLPGIGKLSIKTRAAREGRNPATGEAITIPAKNAVKFSAAKALKDAINV